MLAIVKDSPTVGVILKELPTPIPKSGEVLVKVLKTSICGTDIGIYDFIPWAKQQMKLPTIIGHEMVGEVLEINGNAQGLKVGDLVSSETHIFCGGCYQCVIGNLHLCLNMLLFGISRDGSFAKYATIPLTNVWKNDPSLDLDILSVQEPLGNAVHAVTKAQVRNKKILILGLGPVGLCAGAVARSLGANQIFAVDTEKYRQDLALNSGWFDKVSSTIPDEDKGSFEVVFEISGDKSAIQSAFEVVTTAGKIMAVGIPKEEVLIDWGKFIINKELTIESIFGRKIWATWEQVARLLKSKEIDLKNIITHHFPLSEFESAMELMKSRQCGKIVLEP